MLLYYNFVSVSRGSFLLFFCVLYDLLYVFFFKQKTAYEMRISDWSSDVCSSDLPNIALPDTDTLRAVLVHRFQVMSDYFRGVIVPTLRAEAQQAGDSLRALPRRMRKALINGGRWLDDDAGQRLRTFIAQRPNLATVYEFPQRLRSEEHTSEIQSLMR